MKRSSPFWRRGVLLAGFAVLLGAPVRYSPAIPNQIGGFINLAGMNFEDFAALPETWTPGAKLKATWERWKSAEVTDTAIELQRLTVSAMIFGLPTSEVTVQRVDDLAIRFDAIFTPAKGATLDQLELASIDAGLPVLVWRRWTQERDYLHSTFLRRMAKDPEARLPEPDAADRSSWPEKDAYNHSSVISGYNTERREVIFSESWSESVRNRRMRPEEMAATAYYTFSLRPVA